jgi:hypothetical protein
MLVVVTKPAPRFDILGGEHTRTHKSSIPRCAVLTERPADVLQWTSGVDDKVISKQVVSTPVKVPFKRFSRLSARILLTLQAELADLEIQLDNFDNEDRATAKTMQSLRNWADYKARETEDPRRMKLMAKLRSTIKEYSTVT